MRLSLRARQVTVVTSLALFSIVVLAGVYLSSLVRLGLEENRARGELLARAIFHRARLVVGTAEDPQLALAARGESRSYEGSTQSIRRTTLTRMAMGTRETDQPPLWIATSDLPTSPGHPFYARLTTLLDGHHVDRFVEGLCDRFYAPVMGRPSLAPGRYFRLRLVGSFEGIDSERGIAWRATDSLAVRSFLRLAVDEAPPDHSTIARTRRLIDLETHRTVFTWVQQRLVEAGRLTGKTIAIDATTLETTGHLVVRPRPLVGELVATNPVDRRGPPVEHTVALGALQQRVVEKALEHHPRGSATSGEEQPGRHSHLPVQSLSRQEGRHVDSVQKLPGHRQIRAAF